MKNNQINRKRNIPVCIRLSEKEYKVLEKKLEKAKMNKTEYLVKILLGKEIRICSFDKDINNIIYELQKIGVNPNQISRNLNSSIFQDAAKDIRQITEEHTEMCNQFLNFINAVKIE